MPVTNADLAILGDGSEAQNIDKDQSVRLIFGSHNFVLGFTHGFDSVQRRSALVAGNIAPTLHRGIIQLRLLSAERIMRYGQCKLCLEDGELQRSHLIPAGVFRSLRSEGEDPTAFTAKKIVQTSRQFQAHLLCRVCEDRLNKGGETYVLKNMARRVPDSAFPLFDFVNQGTVCDADDDCRIYDTSNVPEIDAAKLGHFALGMIWKTSARDWVGVDGYSRRLELGIYAEPIRRYLLGAEPFPRNCFVHVFVWPDKSSVSYGTYLPRRHPVRQSHVYSYYLPGITFCIYVGKGVAQEQRELCCYSNERKPISASIYIAQQNLSLLGQLSNFPRNSWQWPRPQFG